MGNLLVFQKFPIRVSFVAHLECWPPISFSIGITTSQLCMNDGIGHFSVNESGFTFATNINQLLTLSTSPEFFSVNGCFDYLTKGQATKTKKGYQVLKPPNLSTRQAQDFSGLGWRISECIISKRNPYTKRIASHKTRHTAHRSYASHQ